MPSPSAAVLLCSGGREVLCSCTTRLWVHLTVQLHCSAFTGHPTIVHSTDRLDFCALLRREGGPVSCTSTRHSTALGAPNCVLCTALLRVLCTTPMSYTTRHSTAVGAVNCAAALHCWAFTGHPTIVHSPDRLDTTLLHLTSHQLTPALAIY